MAELLLARDCALDPDDLVTHGVILGRTGSGKTGLGTVILEELALSGVPLLVIDPKGDMTNLALAFPGLEPQAYAPWVPLGSDCEGVAAAHREGLEASGVDVERVRAYRQAARTTVYAPGWTRGEGVHRVDLLPSLAAPVSTEESRQVSAHGVAEALLGSVGQEPSGPSDPRAVFLAEVLLALWDQGAAVDLDAIVGGVHTPPFSHVGPLPLDDFLPESERKKLARSLVSFSRSAARWLTGTPLGFDELLAPTAPGAPPQRTSVFSLGHLDPAERAFFLTLFLHGLLEWLGRQPGTSKLRALLWIEEARGILPPHPQSPPTKAPLARLLAQARAFGLGVVLSTQHPVDLDYKALSNVGTWFLGNLRERDLKRDLLSELQDKGVDASRLASLPRRQFLLRRKAGAVAPLTTRFALSYLRGPISPAELPKLAPYLDPPPGAAPRPRRAEPPRPTPPAPVPPPARAEPAPPESAPAPAPRDAFALVLPEGWGGDPWARRAGPSKRFLKPPHVPRTVPVLHEPPASTRQTWAPSAYARVRAVFGPRRLEVIFATPLLGEELDWSHALALEPRTLRSGPPEGWHEFGAVPLAAFKLRALEQHQTEAARVALQRLRYAEEPAPVADLDPTEHLRSALLALSGSDERDLMRLACVAVFGTRLPPPPGWTPPPDLADRASRVAEALVVPAAPRSPAPFPVPCNHAEVVEVGLLWTRLR
ncbi:MAG: helicase HerA-like domain-containing protein [Planctomycetota bacterium]